MKNKKLVTLLGSMSLVLILVTLLFLPACAPAVAPEGAEAELEAKLVAEQAKTKAAEAEVADLEAKLAAATAPAEVFEWKMQSGDFAGWTFETCQEHFIDAMLTASDGRLDITMLGVDTLYPQAEGYDFVGKGVGEMNSIAPSYFSGVEKVSNLEWYVPSDPRNSVEIAQFWVDYGFQDMLREMYAKYDVYYLGYALLPPYQVISKVPITSVADLDGMKIRCTGLLQQTFEKAGALPVYIPAMEIYTALAQGVIDAAAWGAPVETVDLALHEIAKYWIEPGITGACPNAYIVNLDAWNALPDSLKKIAHLAMENVNSHMWRGYEYRNAEAKLIMWEAGVTSFTLPDSELAKFMALGDEATVEFAGDDPNCLKYLELYYQQLKDLGY